MALDGWCEKDATLWTRRQHLMLCPRPKLNTRPKSLHPQTSNFTQTRAAAHTCNLKWRRYSYRLLPEEATRWIAAWGQSYQNAAH